MKVTVPRIQLDLKDFDLKSDNQQVILDISDYTINISFGYSIEPTATIELTDGKLIINGWLDPYSDEPVSSIELADFNNPTLIPDRVLLPRLKILEHYLNLKPEYSYDDAILRKLYKQIHSSGILSDFEDPFEFYSEEEILTIIDEFFEFINSVENKD